MKLTKVQIQKIAIFFFLQSYYFLGFAKYKLDNSPTERPFLEYFVLISLLIIVLYSSKVLLFRLKIPSSLLLLIVLLLFFLYGAAHNSRALKDTVYFAINLLSTTMLFLLIREKFIMNRSGDVLILKSIVAFALFSGVIAIYVWLNFGTEFNIFGLKVVQNIWTATRIHGFLGEPTSLGCLIALALIIQLNLQKKQSLKSFLILLTLMLLLLFTGSRNSIVSFLFALLTVRLILLYRNPFVSRTKILVSITAFMVFIYILIRLYSAYEDGLSYYFFRGLDNEESRLYVWSMVLNLINEQTPIALLFGSGYGSLSNTYQSGFNNYMQLLYDFGVFGLYVVIIFYFALYFMCRSSELCMQIFFYFLSFLLFMSWFPTDGFNALIISVAYILSLHYDKLPFRSTQ